MHDDTIRVSLRVPAGRRSIRLPTFDYTEAGAYFLTICAKERQPLFGTLDDRTVRLTDAGRAVERCWDDIPRHFTTVSLDAFVVMPDHVHGILILDGHASAAHAPGFPTDGRTASPATPRAFGQCIPGSLATIVGAFKSAATRSINAHNGKPGTRIWQRNYYERVIRSADEMRRIRWYILTNPVRAVRRRPRS